ncbi:P-loop containing nucleoside triphosphate hydrolase protein, partial [Thozetella sp. PMI_491]
FDVYARPFVPEAFTRINRLDGVVVDTPPEKQINFGAYASSSLPDRFLPIIPKPMELPKGLSLDQQDLIDPRKYEQYFSYHIQDEVQAEGRENDKYALYGQEVTVTLQEHYPGSICLFTVPGLREETPRLYEDDIVQLRQLRYDSQGRFLGAAIGQNQFPTASKQEMIPWTGRIYNGRVTRVQLQQELLTVKVYGLDQQSLSLPPGVTAMGQSFSAMFNIQFMAPTERYLPMQHVLPVIQYALHEAITNSNYDNMGKNEVVGSVQHFWYQSMLFPIDTDCDIQENLHPGHFNSPFLDKQLNWEQKKAVQSVCQQNYGTLPYLISGPPGTGKTKTIIETTLQLLVNVKKVNHILLCAPSDPAADTLVDRLRKHLRPQDMLRLNRPTRTFEEIPAEVLPYCYTVSGMFCLPPFPDLMKYRVVVTTCRDAALLMYGRMTNTDLFAAEYGLRKTVHPFGLVEPVELHWSALLMDEAAQALEAEALIPISVVAPPQLCPHLVFMPLLVMAGDQCQLGPHTFLPKTPLKMSLFARLFSRSVYADHPMARGRKGQAPPPLSSGMLPILRPAFTNLIRNYRSHTAILAIPSALFYHDTLECEAPVAQQNTLVEWSGWKGKRWPVLFHSNPYRDDIEREGGGWYNTAEVEIAALYVKSLVGFGVAQKDICIMSPFKAQVRLLRRKMRDPRFGNYYDVNIGPTEAFQGLEKGVVILCTTRSKPRFVEKDIERDWGIVGLPNKMNVALTRAQYGLIIIGKRAVLKID